ncbi:hypothetical protein BJ742DRAFT_798309 [Cladochytrium replicatum]|nr:hypothetical protein BJ742DRAFT_798309 [Cladochytrium replicatum]
MSSTNGTDSAAAIAQLQQQISILRATLSDVVTNIPSIMLAGAGCLAAGTVFLWTLVQLYRQKSVLVGSSLNRRGVRAWLLAVSATFCLVGTALIAASFGSSYLLMEGWFYMACFFCAGMTTAIVNVCAVERFLVILTNRTVKWSILVFAILANAVNVVQYVYLMWIPTDEALHTPNQVRYRPVYSTIPIIVGCTIPSVLILVTGIGVFSVILFRHLKDRENYLSDSSQPRSRPLTNPNSLSPSQSKLKSIYLVLVVHHFHILTTVAVYLIFGVSIILTLNQSGLRGPLAFFMYTTIIAIETGLEDVSRAIARSNNGKEPTRNEPQLAVVNVDHSQTTAVASQPRTPVLMNPPTPTPGSATIQHARTPTSMMFHYNPIFAQQPHPDGMDYDANSRSTAMWSSPRMQ